MGEMEYIRKTYGVPAKRGTRVRFRGCDGMITGACHGRLRVRLSNGHRVLIHPTWCVEYLEVGRG